MKKWLKIFPRITKEGDKKGEKKALEEAFQKEEMTPELIDHFVKIATPVPFGVGTKEVLDPKIRNVLEIPAATFSEFDDLFRCYPIGFVTQLMAPPSVTWRAELYKMHLYGPGGKFDEHMDTLHANNHVATIVVCLLALGSSWRNLVG